MADLDRHLRFPGTINFRDMGGYQTSDGGRVRTGQLFRSGHLAHVEPDALSDIAKLNITLLCDFRVDDERAEHPNRYAEGHTPAVKHLPVWPSKTPGSDEAAKKILMGEIGIEDASGYLGSGYREFIRDQSNHFANVFSAILSDGHIGILLHCSAAKDRTGIAAALLLTALGVHREDVVKDYMLSVDGHGAAPQTQFYVDKEWNKRGGERPHCSKEDIFTLFSVHPQKINAAFDEMNRIAESADGYLRDVLGLTNDALTELRQRYVDPA